MEKPQHNPAAISRRQFLKYTALAGAASVLAACGANTGSTPTPSSQQAASSPGTSLPTPTVVSSQHLGSNAFDWQKYKGTSLKLLLNKHPYADALVADLQTFTDLTGIRVTYDIFPEDVYFDKVTTALSSRSSQYDALMTGAYQTWVYGPANWLVDLRQYIQDENLTNPDFDVQDFIPNILQSDSWSGKPGEAPGQGDAKQWALPFGFEINSLSYNKQVFAKHKLRVPRTLPEIIETAEYISKKEANMYGIGVRGSRSWATIHPGFLSAYTCYHARDFDDHLKAAMNSPQAVEMTKLWVQMIKKGGPPTWTQYTWYEVGNDLGAGKSAMIYDADILGYFQNRGTKAAGHIGWAPVAANPDDPKAYANVWIWSLAMSNFSNHKEATWYFLQWATGKAHLLKGAVEGDQVDPVRHSVANHPKVVAKLKQKYPGYLESFNQLIPNSKIYFTPQPLFFDVTTDWAATLQKMVTSGADVKASLDELAESINKKMADAGITQ